MDNLERARKFHLTFASAKKSATTLRKSPDNEVADRLREMVAQYGVNLRSASRAREADAERSTWRSPVSERPDECATGQVVDHGAWSGRFRRCPQESRPVNAPGSPSNGNALGCFAAPFQLLLTKPPYFFVLAFGNGGQRKNLQPVDLVPAGDFSGAVVGC